MEELKKVVVTGDPYSSMMFIHAVKDPDYPHRFTPGDHGATTRVGNKQVHFEFIPPWKKGSKDFVARDCYDGDACVVFVNDGSYEYLPSCESICQSFKEYCQTPKLIMLHEDPRNGHGEDVAKGMGAEYVPIPGPLDYHHVIEKVANMV